MDRIPFLLLGDGPGEPTGLGRIARDLAGLIASSDLPYDLLQVGGTVPPVWNLWPHVPLDRSNDDWGARAVEGIYRSRWGNRPGILFAVWDPARLYAYLQIDLPVQRWAYCAIDAENVYGGIGGPAAEVVQQFDRVLAYGRYGSRVLGKTQGREGCREGWLPHGLGLAPFLLDATPDEARWAQDLLGPYAVDKVLIGAVMANQPRKEFGLLFQTVAELRRRGINPYLWLHTDVLVKAWSVQQLVADLDLAKRVTVTTEMYTDRQLACLYQQCAVTLLPSGGEGFGYPIVESLACGVPCVATASAGGAVLVPKVEWRVPVREWRLESVYALNRPVMRVEDWANAAMRALDWCERMAPEVRAGYCRGSVQHLDWAAVWPRWRTWLMHRV